MKTIYKANATTVAGRAGHTKTDDGKLDLDLSPPGSDGPGTNPEQLFACGYSACFGGAVEAVARRESIKIGTVEVGAQVSLNQSDEKGFFISVVLNTHIDGLDGDAARDLVRKAHQLCPYSNATRGNIDVIVQADGVAI